MNYRLCWDAKHDPDFMLFESDVERLLGDRVRASREDAEALWGALANIDWNHDGLVGLGYTMRSAGGLVARIRGSGDYLDWYCSGPHGVVADWISEAMATAGWTWEARGG